MKKLLAGIAVAALCGAPAIAAPPAAPMFNWTGFYVGLNAGYGMGNMSSQFSSTNGGFAVPPSLSPDGNGFIGGAQAGYNWRNSSFVAGLETDISYSGIRGKDSGVAFIGAPFTTSVEQKIPWFGTARGRLGILVSENFLIFATGGLAYGEKKTSFLVGPNFVGGDCTNASCAIGSTSHVSATWTLGGGFEYAFSPRATWKLEYLYFDLGSQSVTAPISLAVGTVTAKSDFAASIVRTGLNWRW